LRNNLFEYFYKNLDRPTVAFANLFQFALASIPADS